VWVWIPVHREWGTGAVSSFKVVLIQVSKRVCSHGLFCQQNILVGDSSIVLTGGVDNMSQSPYSVRNVRFGVPLGAKIEFEDSLWVGLTDSYCNLPMALTAENLASKFNISRKDCDEFSLRSQQNWKKGTYKTTLTVECHVDFSSILFKTHFCSFLQLMMKADLRKN